MSRRPRLPALPPVAGALAGLALLLVVGGARHPGFVSWRVLTSLLDDGAVLGLLAIGSAFVIFSGGIDLSVGAVMALASTVCAVALERWGLGPPAAVALTLGLGLAFGLLQGAWIQGAGLPAFIVTLAGMFLARGLALWVHDEALAIRAERWLAWSAARVELPGGVRLGLGGVVFVACALAGVLVARRTRFGRALYALGGDEESALLLAVPVAGTRVAVYGLSGLCAAAAGVLFCAYAASGSPTAGTGKELEAIAACVVGGVLLEGGVGGVGGAALGVLFFGLVQSLILFEGTLGAGWTRVAVGGMLLIFLVAQRALGRGGAAPGGGAGRPEGVK